MKKTKSNIISFILGAIIFGTIGVIAANYSADTIEYKTDKNNEIKNVQQALDDLYTKRKNINLNIFGTSQFDDVRTTTSSSTLNLKTSISKGKYLLIVGYARAWVSSSNYNDIWDSNREITCDSNNCVINFISGRGTNKSGSTKKDSSYVVTSGRVEVYYIEIKEDSDNLNLPYSSGSLNNTAYPQVLYTQTIPLG